MTKGRRSTSISDPHEVRHAIFAAQAERSHADQVLQLIQRSIRDLGRMPTRPEIAQAFAGYRTKDVNGWLAQLVGRGDLVELPGAMRLALARAPKSDIESQIRNIVHNAEQISDIRVSDLIHSMRSALGLKPGERV